MNKLKIMTKEKGIEYYKDLEIFYKDLLEHKATEKQRRDILDKTITLITYTAKKIDERMEEKGVDERQTFNLEFIELMQQIAVIIKRLNLKVLKFNSLKLKILKEELASMLDYHQTATLLQKIKSISKVEIVRLLIKTLKGVSITFALALVTNFILSKAGILTKFEDSIKVLLSLEAGMAALIVFITSFNLSYTNSKRGKTDMELINFMTKLNIYARRMKFLIMLGEPDKKKREELFENINYYFNCIGLKLIDGVNPTHKHNLKFDITILQSLDLIQDLIGGYINKMEEVSKIRTRQIQDDVVTALNDFQITATVRTPKVFSSLNDWLIKLTYFVLVAISPLSIIPRLFILNVFQRAFFNVAREVDNAIYSTSIATLPVENRVVRRLCRISSILNEDEELGV